MPVVLPRSISKVSSLATELKFSSRPRRSTAMSRNASQVEYAESLSLPRRRTAGELPVPISGSGFVGVSRARRARQTTLRMARVAAAKAEGESFQWEGT